MIKQPTTPAKMTNDQPKSRARHLLLMLFQITFSRPCEGDCGFIFCVVGQKLRRVVKTKMRENIQGWEIIRNIGNPPSHLPCFLSSPLGMFSKKPAIVRVDGGLEFSPPLSWTIDYAIFD